VRRRSWDVVRVGGRGGAVAGGAVFEARDDAGAEVVGRVELGGLVEQRLGFGAVAPAEADEGQRLEGEQPESGRAESAEIRVAALHQPPVAGDVGLPGGHAQAVAGAALGLFEATAVEIELVLGEVDRQTFRRRQAGAPQQRFRPGRVGVGGGRLVEQAVDALRGVAAEERPRAFSGEEVHHTPVGA